MLNFGGHTRKRVVNLGTKNRSVSKKDVLERAEQERRRRAEGRREEDAARLIQRNIRRTMSLEQFFRSNYTTLSDRQKGSLLMVFKTRIFHYIGGTRDFEKLLADCRDYISHSQNILGKSLVIDLLRNYPDDTFFIHTLNLLNLDPLYFDINSFVHDGLIPFLNNISRSGVSEECSVVLCRFLKVYHTVDNNSWISELYAKMKTQPVLFKYLEEFNLFPFVSIPDPQSLNNMCYMYSHGIEANKGTVVNYILDIVYRTENQWKIKPEDFSNVIFEKDFIERTFKFCEITEKNHHPGGNIATTNDNIHSPIGIFDKLLYLAHDEDEKNNILMLLLLKPSFIEILYDTLRKNESSNIFHRPEFKISRDLIKFYLQFATDIDLQTETRTSYIPFSLIEWMTNLLKTETFNVFWCNEIPPNSNLSFNIEKEISLLNQLYLRDSRSHFLSRGEKSYWSRQGTEFLGESDLYKILIQFEEFFEEMPPDTDLYERRNSVLEKLLNEKFHGIMSSQFRKLNLLIKVPFLIPFNQRVDYFYFLIETKKRDAGYNNELNWLTPGLVGFEPQGRRAATISREHVLEDAMKAFSFTSDLKANLSVTFVNEFGKEEGIDGGGVTKEFLTSVIDEGFKDTKYDLFAENEQHELYPRPTTNPERLKVIMFLGRIVGKCLYDRILVDLTFADFFLKILLTGYHHLSIDDLRSLDSELYDNLIRLLNMTEEEISQLELTFETTDMFNPTRTVNLIPDGNHVMVSKENVLQYVWKVSQYKLRAIARSSTKKFLEGLNNIIPQHWFGMFNTVDFQMLISGGHRPIDIADLKENTVYGGYEHTDATVVAFWEVLEEFSDDEKRKFLKFVTSVPQAPLKGFGALNPNFGVSNTRDGDLNRLPTASTCVNLLKLPDYGDKDLMREKLTYAINSGARFDLS